MKEFIKSIKSDWLYGKVSSRIKKGNYRDAIELIDKIISLKEKEGPFTSLILFDMAHCYYKCDENENALKYYSEAYEKYLKYKGELKYEYINKQLDS